MSKKISVAILGSTGYVGLELVKILSKHPSVDIVFIGTENSPNISIQKLDSSIDISDIPNTQLNKDFDYNFADIEKGLEESVVMAVVLDHEDFFTEYEPITKTYLNNIQMFFQIIFYDFKSRKLVASIPYDV